MTRTRTVNPNGWWNGPRRGVTILCAAVLLLLRGNAASATVIVPMELAELTRAAHEIVRGRVVAVESRWTDDRRGVETLVTISVAAGLKGAVPDAGEAITFRVAGGRLGRIRNIVVGAPQFAVDQDVVVFLGHRGPSIAHIVGFNQGVFRIAASDGGSLVLPPVLDGTTMTGPVVRGDGARRPVALAAFERQVRALAQEVR